MAEEKRRQTAQSNIAGDERSILAAIGAPVFGFLLDGDLSLLWANPVFYRTTGYEGVACQGGCSLRALLSDTSDDFFILKRALEEAQRRRESHVERMLRLISKDASSQCLRACVTITDERQAGFAVCYAVLSDVSDRMEREATYKVLYEDKARCFEWMMDEYAGNIYICDMQNYELLYLNKAALEELYEISHLTPGEILGHKCYEVIQGKHEPCSFCTNSLLTEDAFYEWEFHNPNLGRTFLIKNRIVNWYGHRARIELSHDMYSTEYKLVKKEREKEAIVRTIPGGFARVDARDMRTILWYGGGFLQLIGYTQDQFERELHSQCTYVHPDDMAHAIHIMEESKRQGDGTATEARVVTHGGEIKTLAMTFSYVNGADSWDGIPSFYSVGVDVTKERREEARQRKALEEAYQTARVANAAKTNFLSSMSHNIRTPMNAIIGMTAIARANIEAQDKLRDCLQKIDTSSQHLLSLINEVLDMSRIESGKIDLVLSQIHLPGLIERLTDMCRPLIIQKSQHFQVSISRIDHENIVADGERLLQILMNLLSNAVKYTPEGGTISLRINERHSAAPHQRQYEFICGDNGIGISDDFMPHLFKPFARAEDPRISKLQGTGLGMAITQNIVRMMNGTIDVRSKLGEGSEFTVSIPFELGEEEVTYGGELQGLPVLVVDDDQVTCENAVAMLEELGMRGAWVLSGQEAVERVAAVQDVNDDFFAILLDWKMPEMDGLQTIEAIRRLTERRTPVVMISAYDYSEIEREFVKAGADAFIAKPLFKSALLHTLRRFLPQSNAKATPISQEREPTDLAGKRVLLAEDNDINREIAVELLHLRHMEVVAVEDGRLALEAFEASSPGEYDAILMDIQMPRLNGYDAAVAIRTLAREDAQTIPIIAMTADAFITDVAMARNAGMNDHIAKPIDMEHLLNVMRRWIR